MKFERLSLQDFQSYDDLDVEFENGLTLIHGANGAGKSTIARALYTTLYPRFGRNKIGAHELPDLIQDGKDSAHSELVFSVGDDRYQIAVDINRKSNGGAKAGATMTVLKTGETYSTSSTEIEEKVTQLLGMNAEAFANSTYAQQTQLTRLIEAPKSKREAMLDNLLGLTAPDAYADDISKLKKEVKSWRDDKRSQLKSIRDEIESLEADEPKATLQSKTRVINRLDDRISQLSDGLDEARDRLRDVESDIDDHREKTEELDDLRGEHEEIGSTIGKLESDISELGTKIESCTETIDSHREAIERRDEEVDGFDLTDPDEADEATTRFEERYDDANATVEQRRADVDRAKETVNRLKGEFEELRDELDEVQTRCDTYESKVEDAEQELDETEGTLDRHRETRDERLVEFLNTSPEDVDDHESAVRDRMSELRDEKSDCETNREKKRDRRARLADDIETAEDELIEARERRNNIRESLESDIDDPEAAFEAAVERADEEASALGFDVTAEDIDTVFTGNLPEELDVTIGDHRTAAEGLAEARETAGKTFAQIEDLRSLAAGKWPLDGDDIGTSHDYGDHLKRLEEEQDNAKATTVAARDELDSAEARLHRVQDVAEALFEAASFRALADVAAEVEKLEDDIESAEETRAELKDSIESLDDEIDHLEDALSEGDTVLGAIDDAQTASDEVEKAQRELEDVREKLANVKDDNKTLKNDIGDKKADIEDARDELETAEAALDEAESELADIEAARDAAREALESHGKVETLDSDRAGHRSRRSDKRDQLETEREELADVEDDIETLEAEINDTTLEELQEKKEETKELIDEVNEQLENARSERDDAKDAKSKAEDRLDRLRDKREKKVDLEGRVKWAQGLLGDFETVTSTYDEVQTRMRERVIGRLKQHTNEVFRDLYQNSTYEAVDIDENYNLQLVSGSETRRDPDKASGGEGVLVTIALRAGVYRVLADQADGRDDRLPPFILDEPTNHLDPTHIDHLEEAIQSIRDWEVPQVFVVDRYEGLVQGADNRIRVERDDGAGASTLDDETPERDVAERGEVGGD